MYKNSFFYNNKKKKMKKKAELQKWHTKWVQADLDLELCYIW